MTYGRWTTIARSLGGMMAVVTAGWFMGCTAGPIDSEGTENGEPGVAVDEDMPETAPPPPPQTCVTIKRGGAGNVTDAFLAGDFANYATGTEINMYSGVSSGGNLNRIVVGFDLSSIPAYATINSAVFSIYKSWSTGAAQVEVHRATTTWSEATVTRESFGNNSDPVALGSFSGGGVGIKQVDITSLVQAWKNGVYANQGIVLEEPPVDHHHYFSSESNAALAPSLDVCYVNASCSDGIKNQGETGLDCGGPCAACPTCNDGIQNQSETGVDCGGPCAACASCNDGVKNGAETGVDCGGSCAACPTCNDGIQNQGETGLDCGGPCNPCGNLCHPIGYNSCPSGATQFCSNQAISGTNAAQAKAACEACYGHTCYLSNADCAGPGYGPSPSYSCGDPYWGYSSGCSGSSGRVWYICSSYTTYGYWAN